MLRCFCYAGLWGEPGKVMIWLQHAGLEVFTNKGPSERRLQQILCNDLGLNRIFCGLSWNFINFESDLEFETESKWTINRVLTFSNIKRENSLIRIRSETLKVCVALRSEKKLPSLTRGKQTFIKFALWIRARYAEVFVAWFKWFFSVQFNLLSLPHLSVKHARAGMQLGCANTRHRRENRLG